MSLREALKRILEEAVEKDKMRQEIQDITRKTTRLSKQAIFLVHKEKIEEAEGLLREANENLRKLNSISRNHLELFYTGLVGSTFEEYAEAHIFINLVKEGKFIDPEGINVPSEAYVLGLVDVIGELRRRSLDLIRRGDVRASEECLDLMETIYIEILSCDELLILIPGIRRKCDVARRLIEATRGDVTTETRRTLLNNAMKDLQRTLEAKIGSKL